MASDAPMQEEVRLLHLSDTHGMHRSIEADFPLPPADILLHTGDFTNCGFPGEFEAFDAWLKELQPRYRHIVVICGNHEWNCLGDVQYSQQSGLFDKVRDSSYAQSLLPHAKVLEHQALALMGLNIYGSTWCPWHGVDDPGDTVAGDPGLLHARNLWQASAGPREHRFDEIPEGVDVLMTHGAPYGSFDQLEGTRSHWGSSKTLLAEVLRAKPRVHLFGHIHEQRGHWQRRPDGSGFTGGVEYCRIPGESWTTFDPPPPDYPCDLICCGAMKNHPGLDGGRPRIAGPARLIVARRRGGPWSFEAVPPEQALALAVAARAAPQGPLPGVPEERVRLLHLSDTHGMHRSIEARFPLPEADILLHTGDFTNRGLPEEYQDFDAWLRDLRPRFRHIVVICGNHEWLGVGHLEYAQQAGLFQQALDPAHARRLLPHATVLEHEAVSLLGLQIYGSPWCPWHCFERPGDGVPREPGLQYAMSLWQASAGPREHRFDEIPGGVDVLMTHGAPYGIFDQLEGSQSHWGSSRALRLEVQLARPRVHLFGHIHEQRGYWQRRPDGRGFDGGVEYSPRPGQRWSTFDPPPPDYPCDIISCGAMSNHSGLDGAPGHIAGPARLIVARRQSGGAWKFEVHQPA